MAEQSVQSLSLSQVSDLDGGIITASEQVVTSRVERD
jgi:hypothetical protein